MSHFLNQWWHGSPKYGLWRHCSLGHNGLTEVLWYSNIFWEGMWRNRANTCAISVLPSVRSSDIHLTAVSLEMLEILTIEMCLKLHTVECRYNMVQFITILNTALRWQQQNLNQTSNSQQTPHTSPSRVSYEVSVMRYWRKLMAL